MRQHNSGAVEDFMLPFRSLSTNPEVKELLKSVHICQSYHKNKSGTFFMAHGVYIIIIIVQTWRFWPSAFGCRKLRGTSRILFGSHSVLNVAKTVSDGVLRTREILFPKLEEL